MTIRWRFSASHAHDDRRASLRSRLHSTPHVSVDSVHVITLLELYLYIYWRCTSVTSELPSCKFSCKMKYEELDAVKGTMDVGWRQYGCIRWGWRRSCAAHCCFHLFLSYLLRFNLSPNRARELEATCSVTPCSVPPISSTFPYFPW